MRKTHLKKKRQHFLRKTMFSVQFVLLLVKSIFSGLLQPIVGKSWQGASCTGTSAITPFLYRLLGTKNCDDMRWMKSFMWNKIDFTQTLGFDMIYMALILLVSLIFR